MRLPNLQPADVRGMCHCNTEHGPEFLCPHRVILWHLVTPWLNLCQQAGDLHQLAEHLNLSEGALRKKRRALGMPALPSGRPRVTELSEKQQHILTRMKEGKTVTEIAVETGVSPQSVSAAKAKAEAKATPDRRECKRCGTQGVIECGSKEDTTTYPMHGDTQRRNVFSEPPVAVRLVAPCSGIGSHFHMCPDCLGDGFLGPS